jgi:hypothetical protein
VSLVAPAACRRTSTVAAAGSPVDLKCKIPPVDPNLEFATTVPEVLVDARDLRELPSTSGSPLIFDVE